MPRDAVSRTANVGTVGNNGSIRFEKAFPAQAAADGVPADPRCHGRLPAFSAVRDAGREVRQVRHGRLGGGGLHAPDGE